MRSLVFFLFGASFLFSCSSSESLPAAVSCDNAIEASLANYSDLDGCAWVFQSDVVDQIIEPINLADFISDPEESKSVLITYIERPDIATVCQAGLIVELTCVE